MHEVAGRVRWADAARGMAIALVVLHHTVKRSVVAGSADWWLVVTEMLECVRMPLLFAVAGVFAATWVGEQRSWTDLLRTKVLLFAWVYALWVGLHHVWVSTVPGSGAAQPLDQLAWRLVLPSTGWFIFTLALMFVLAKALRRLPPPVVLVAAAVVSIVFLAGWVEVGNRAWDGLGKYAVFFLLGVALRRQVHVVDERVPRRAAVLVPLAWAATYALLASLDLQDAPVLGFVMRLTAIAAGVCVALHLQRWRALRALGRRTLPVYMTHQLVIVTAVSALGSLASFEHGPMHQAAPLLLAAVLIPATYGVGLLAPRIGLGWLFATPRWLLPQRTVAPSWSSIPAIPSSTVRSPVSSSSANS